MYYVLRQIKPRKTLGVFDNLDKMLDVATNYFEQNNYPSHLRYDAFNTVNKIQSTKGNNHIITYDYDKHHAITPS